MEHDLELRGRIVDTSSRRRSMEGQLRLLSTGALLASATAVMILVDERHVARHERWLAEQAGSADSTPALTTAEATIT